MLGCFERALFPSVSRSASKLVPNARIPARQSCCGALHAHNGELERGRELAVALGEELPGTIVTTSGGCAAHLSSVLGRERVRELSDWLAEQGGELPTAPSRRLRVALQDSCHLRNGIGVWRQPRDLIREVADYVELESAAACCGAAGSYSILRKHDSNAILDTKLDEIAALDLDYVVAVNPGCLRQLQQGLRRRGLRTRAVHLAEFLTEAKITPGS
jgi:glycolate oxidase iron-sulfur subunit